MLNSADDAPELTDAFFAAATVRDGDKVVRRGRPKHAAGVQAAGKATLPQRGRVVAPIR